jgi:hypothetical protein
MKEVTMGQPQLMANYTVAEVMDCQPQTISILFRYRMASVGCPVAPFKTQAEVVTIYVRWISHLCY